MLQEKTAAVDELQADIDMLEAKQTPHKSASKPLCRRIIDVLDEHLSNVHD